jgi:hypothetical protein
MHSKLTTYKSTKAEYKNSKALALLLILLASSSSCFMPCVAQSQYLAPPPSVLGDNSTVPPEVVPLVEPPAPAGASGAYAGASDVTQQLGANAPGLTSPEQTGAGPANALNGMQTAKQARSAALNSLMGNQEWSPQLNEELQAQAQAKAAALAAAQPGASNNVSGANGGSGVPGAPNNTIASNGQTGVSNNDYSESQTLTGGVKYQQNYQNTQRSGFTNASSSSLGLVSGYANPSNVSTAGASYGLGIPFFLLGATGLGIRNGFRW